MLTFRGGVTFCNVAWNPPDQTEISEWSLDAGSTWTRAGPTWTADEPWLAVSLVSSDISNMDID